MWINSFKRRLSIPAVVAGVMLCLMSATTVASDLPSLKGSKAETLEACVEPTDEMRRNHMKFILHERDETVHQGIRGRKHSLAGCVDCHVSRDQAGSPLPINAEGQFCESCHDFAAVSIDCFQCHAKVPTGRGK